MALKIKVGKYIVTFNKERIKTNLSYVSYILGGIVFGACVLIIPIIIGILFGV